METSPAPQFVRSDDADGIRTITLSNPAARNALSGPMMSALETAILAAGSDSAVRVIVLAA
ncbi:MAG: enoyl-CoA hydratase, partial [Gammaproteobacteria bacterium]